MRKKHLPRLETVSPREGVKKYFRAAGRIYDADGYSGSLYGTSVSVVIQLRW